MSGELVDISVIEGMVDAVHPTGTSRPSSGVEVWEAREWLVHGALVEPHAHLDKVYLAERAPNRQGDLMGAIAAMQSIRDTTPVSDIVARAHRAVDAFISRGTTRIRSHADTTLDNGLRSVQALTEVREARRDDIDIQVAALLDWPLTGRQSAERRAMARDAVDMGADVIGGCPHLDDDPRQAIEWLLAEAIDLGVPLDIHADENLRPQSRDLEILADIMLAEGIRHPVTAGHCVSLSTASQEDIVRVAEKVSAAGISVVALPHTNLFLQGREMESGRARGVAPVVALARAGVVVGAGGDNMQDPFHPLGRADPYDVAALMVLTAHVTVETASSMVTTHGGRAVGFPVAAPSPGAIADLVLVPAKDWRSALAQAPERRTVVRRGRVIVSGDSDRK